MPARLTRTELEEKVERQRCLLEEATNRLTRGFHRGRFLTPAQRRKYEGIVRRAPGIIAALEDKVLRQTRHEHTRFLLASAGAILVELPEAREPGEDLWPDHRRSPTYDRPEAPA